MQHQGLRLYKVDINEDPGMTLTCFTARSNFVKIACYASDQWSGKSLQDRWSSAGFFILYSVQSLNNIIYLGSVL